MNRKSAAWIGAAILAMGLVTVATHKPNSGARVVGVHVASPASKVEDFCAEIGWEPGAFLARHPKWDGHTTRAIACELCGPWLDGPKVCPNE